MNMRLAEMNRVLHDICILDGARARALDCTRKVHRGSQRRFLHWFTLIFPSSALHMLFPSPLRTPLRGDAFTDRRGGVAFGSEAPAEARDGCSRERGWGVVGGRRAVQYGRGRGGETNYGRPPILPARSAVRVNTVPLTARTTRSPPLPGTKPPVPPSSWVARRGRGQPSDANVPEKMFSSSLDCSNKL